MFQHICTLFVFKNNFPLQTFFFNAYKKMAYFVLHELGCGHFITCHENVMLMNILYFVNLAMNTSQHAMKMFFACFNEFH